jgi:hypothetical protein
VTETTPAPDEPRPVPDPEPTDEELDEITQGMGPGPDELDQDAV